MPGRRRPERIILFGSAARGEMGPDSDLGCAWSASPHHEKAVRAKLDTREECNDVTNAAPQPTPNTGVLSRAGRKTRIPPRQAGGAGLAAIGRRRDTPPPRRALTADSLNHPPSGQ